MPRISFDQLPDSARVWVFGAERPVTEAERGRLLEVVDAFLETWAAHGTPLTVARDWRHDRFLHVGLDEDSVPPSGCSIDAMVNTLKELERELGVRIVDNAPVWFRSGQDVRRESRGAFKALVEAGQVTLETPVFDNSVTRVGQVRAGEWERPASESWHGRAFFRARGAE